MPWYIYLALKQLFPTGRFPFFTLISLGGVAIGVLVMVVATSVMGGFGHQIRELTVNTQGDVQIRSDHPILDAASVQAQLARIPGVVATTPFAEGAVVVIFQKKPQYPGMQGIDVNQVGNVIPINRFIQYGKLDDLDDDSIILGVKVANLLGARVGDKVEIYSPLGFEKMRDNEVLLPRELRVAGYFEIGHQALDSSVALVTLRTMQDLYGLGKAVHGINVKISPGLDADDATARINAALALDGLHARSWLDINQDFLFVLQFEKNLIFFLLTFIIVVAAFSVTSSLLISVIRKTREIGVLGALGAKPRQIAACFCFQGFFIGLAGTVVGLALGFAVLYVRDDIVRIFTQLTGSEAALVRFYQFNHLPSYSDPNYILAIILCTLAISTLAGLLPAWRAAKLKPVEALRSE
ncbi:MAG: ABC transporter permease [Opitutaceae bacterium]